MENGIGRRGMLIGAAGALALAGTAGGAWRHDVGSMADYDASSRRLRADLVPADLQGVLRYATLAANSHNTQPWHFRLGDHAIDILPDFARRTPAVDPDDHHLFVSLGCAAENLSIAAAASGRPGEIDFVDGALRYVYSDGPARSDPLLAAIARRQSTRGPYDGRPVPTGDLAELAQAAAMPGVGLVLLTDRLRMNRVRDLVVAGNSVQLADIAFMRELKQWLRFNPRSAMAAGDGLFAAASGSPVLPGALGGFAFDNFFTASSENDKYARHIDSSAGIAVFVAEREDPANWMRVGRSCQRFALAATRLGLKLAFINQPVEVANLRTELAALIKKAGRRPDIVMRFGYGPALPYAPRRPVEAVMVQ